MNSSSSDSMWSACFPELRIPLKIRARPAGPERAAEILNELKTLCRRHLNCRYIYSEIGEKSFRFDLEHYLTRLKSARRTTLFKGCALTMIHVESIHHDAYVLSLDTAFDPWPRYVKRIGESYVHAKSMRPLGMDQEYDLYVMNRSGAQLLAARFGSGQEDVLTHDIDLSRPPADAEPAPLREAWRRYALLSFTVKAD